MPEQLHVFDELSTRDGFNRSLRHFKFIMRVIGEFESRRNLAEVLGDCLSEKTIEPHQVLPTISAILVDKYRYSCRTHNMSDNFDGFDSIAAEVGKWKAVDLVLVYFHPELGVVAINPKDRAQWESVQTLKKNEMVTVFAGAFQGTAPDKKYREAISLLIAMLEGGKVRTPAVLAKGKFLAKRKPAAPVQAPPAARARRPGGGRRVKEAVVEAPAAPPPALMSYAAQQAAAAEAPAAPPPVAAPSTAAKKMTPMYSIPVTNELFHNGNVEAWKKIIQSYTTKYAGLDVYVFYEGERIHDINTLFKWGKVKHGSSIMIAVAGDDIRDVAKLQRYLKQGASHMFEAFLKAQVGAVLNLF